MLQRQRHDTGTHASGNAPQLAVLRTGSAVGAEQAGDAAAQANDPLATNGDLATGMGDLNVFSGFNIIFFQ